MMESWIFPLTILPGIGLIIMSSTNWATALAGEIERMLNDQKCSRDILHQKIRQLGRLHHALVMLYVAAAICVLGGFLGALTVNWQATYITILVGIGLGFLFVGTAYLISYAFRATSIKRRQFEERLEN